MSENTEERKTPTGEQEKAIFADIDSPTVVSAAAGTGKTTMLVERVLRLISDEKKRVLADTLVIITFTVNATRHLRDKLNSAINEKIEALEGGSERDYLTEQAIRLRNASIATINSFCLGIIKDNIERFDLPVNVTILDDTKAAALQLAAINLTKQDFYADSIVDEENRKRLFYSFNFEKDDALFEAVISAAKTLSSYADAEKWLDEAVDVYSSIEKLEKKYMPVYSEYIKEQRENIEFCEKRLWELIKAYQTESDEMPENTKDEKSAKSKRPPVIESMKVLMRHVSDVLTLMREFEEKPSFEALEKITDIAQMGLPTLDKKDPQNPIKKAVTSEKNRLKNSKSNGFFDNIAKYSVSRSEEEINLKHNRAVCEAFVKLVRRYREYFSEIKRSQGYIDFSDCELMLLDKLRKDRDFRELLSARFSCVIVDEFQDCNDVQAEIFSLIKNNEQFYVGDIKQSIYAFRGGNPEIMARLCKGKNGFNELLMTKNFRSRQSVIDTVNSAFKGLMTEKYGGVDYNENTRLVLGASYPDNGDNSAYDSEIIAVNAKTKTSAEAVADIIYRLMNDESFKITKNGELCKPSYSDFAILMRNKGKFNDYRQALAKLGISSVSPSGKNILDSEEVAMLVCLLKVIDNPLDDREFLHVLMSPLYRFDADEIAKLRLGLLGLYGKISEESADTIATCYKNYALYECLRFCATGPAKDEDFGLSEARKKAEEIKKSAAKDGALSVINQKAYEAYRDITSFRRFMSNNSIVDLIRKICADTDLYAVVRALDESRRRTANLHRFEKTAEDFVSRDGGTLCDFLRFIRQIEENKRGEIEEATVPEDSKNSVSIMTFHASKGLEVPICILAELDTQHSSGDYSGRFLMNHDYFFAISFVDHEARYQANTFAYNAIEIVNRKKLKGEELRLLYVAMTRAKEKLIMVGNFTEDETAPDFAPLLYEGAVPFKWVWRRLLQNGFSTKFICDPSKSEADDASEYPDDTEDYESCEDDEEVVEFEEDIEAIITAEKIKELVEKRYHNEPETIMRAKYSVTELAHKDETMPFVLTKPSFAVKSKIKGTDVGNAYHHTMEHITLDKMRNTVDLNKAASEALDELVSMGKITEDEKKLVKSERVAKFFLGEIGQRMLKSQRIERELAFYAEFNSAEIGISDVGDNVAVQGQIDMFFEESDGIVIVDYKSDTEKNLEKEKESYSLQVKIYAAVCPKLFGKPVKEIFLYSFSNGEAVKI